MEALDGDPDVSSCCLQPEKVGGVGVAKDSKDKEREREKEKRKWKEGGPVVGRTDRQTLRDRWGREAGDPKTDPDAGPLGRQARDGQVWAGGGGRTQR